MYGRPSATGPASARVENRADRPPEDEEVKLTTTRLSSFPLFAFFGLLACSASCSQSTPDGSGGTPSGTGGSTGAVGGTSPTGGAGGTSATGDASGGNAGTSPTGAAGQAGSPPASGDMIPAGYPAPTA